MKYTILYNNVSLIINAREILTAKYEIIIQRLCYVMHITLINEGFDYSSFFLLTTYSIILRISIDFTYLHYFHKNIKNLLQYSNISFIFQTKIS